MKSTGKGKQEVEEQTKYNQDGGEHVFFPEMSFFLNKDISRIS